MIESAADPAFTRNIVPFTAADALFHPNRLPPGAGMGEWRSRIAPDSGGFSSSPVAANGRLYFPSEDGVVYVVRAGREFELLARNDMREMCLATPAVSGDLLLVRTRTHLYALRENRTAARAN
jgi:outer membrane protein assembly factor BamB